MFGCCNFHNRRVPGDGYPRRITSESCFTFRGYATVAACLTVTLMYSMTTVRRTTTDNNISRNCISAEPRLLENHDKRKLHLKYIGDTTIKLTKNMTTNESDVNFFRMHIITERRRGPNIWFYRTGIGAADYIDHRGWTLKTLQTLLRERNDTNKIIDYLKLDVEKDEWMILPNMISTGVLDTVKQLGLEIHTISKTYFEFWTVLEGLEQHGFRRWYWAMNFRGINIYSGPTGDTRSACYEMVYINTKYLRQP